EDVIQPGCALDLVLGRRPGKHEEIILVLPRGALSLRLEHSEDTERLIAHPDRLADGILFSEKLLRHRSTEHAHVRGPLHVLLRETTADSDRPSADAEVFRRHPAVSGVPVVVAV